MYIKFNLKINKQTTREASDFVRFIKENLKLYKLKKGDFLKWYNHNYSNDSKGCIMATNYGNTSGFVEVAKLQQIWKNAEAVQAMYFIKKCKHFFDSKIQYYNRSWQRYDYESNLRQIAENIVLKAKKNINKF